MRLTAALLSALRPTRSLSYATPSSAVVPKKCPPSFKLNTSTPHARRIVRAVLTSPVAHATPFGGLSIQELYDEIKRQFPDEIFREDEQSISEEREERKWSKQGDVWTWKAGEAKAKEVAGPVKAKAKAEVHPISSIRCVHLPKLPSRSRQWGWRSS